MSNYLIRLARHKDVKAIKEIELAASSRFKGLGLVDDLLDHHFDQALLKNLMAEQQVWIAEEKDGKPIGFAIAAVLGKLAYLEELDVLPAHGRQGVGRSLVAAVVDWARAERFRHLSLSTFAHIPWNAPFYQRLNFEILPPQKWETELHEIHILEEKIGLPIEQRVFMRLQL